MKNNRRKQGVTIAILLFAVVMLSVGFSSLSATLTISSSASVSPNEDLFSVKFSSSNSELLTNEVVPATLNPSTLQATNGVIDNSMDPTISGFNVNFTEPGQSVTYDFYLMNTGEYKAYLSSSGFSDIENGIYKRCIASSDATQESVDQACQSIDATIYFAGYTITDETSEFTYEMAPGAVEKITLKIEYASNGTKADGDFSVEFGDMSMTFETTNTGGEIVTPEPSDTSCFVSVIPGEINKYVCDDTNIIIPNDLELSPVQVDTITFNSEKCSVVESQGLLTMLGTDCSQIESVINTGDINTIFNDDMGLISVFTDITYTETDNVEPITKIGNGVFGFAQNLNSLYVSSNITDIENFSFGGSGISELTFEDGLKNIGMFTFALNGFETLNLPDSVESIGQYAFVQNTNLKTLKLSNSLTTLEDFTFQGCALTSLEIPSGVTAIKTNAFSDNKLISVTIPNTVATIGESAFSINEISVLNFENESNLIEIGYGAFSGNRITNLILPDSVEIIREDAFFSNGLVTLELGTNLTTIEKRAFGAGRIASIGGVDVDYDTNALTSVKIYALSSNVSIGEGAFGWLQDGNHFDNNIQWMNG